MSYISTTIKGIEYEVDYDYINEPPDMDYPRYSKITLNSVTHEGDEMIEHLSTEVLELIEDKCIEREY